MDAPRVRLSQEIQGVQNVSDTHSTRKWTMFVLFYCVEIHWLIRVNHRVLMLNLNLILQPRLAPSATPTC